MRTILVTPGNTGEWRSSDGLGLPVGGLTQNQAKMVINLLMCSLP